MAAPINQFTGSNDVSTALTSSNAISANVLTAQYGITQELTQFQSHISDVLRSRGTKGSTKTENFQKYLHQRQENIIEYSHNKDGYGYIYIRPGDMNLEGPPALGYQKHPTGTVIPSNKSAFAEFTIPKNATIWTGTNQHQLINVELSASAAFLASTKPFLLHATQNLLNNAPFKAMLNIGKYPLTLIKTAGAAYNTDFGIAQNWINGQYTRGTDAGYHVLRIPASKIIANQSEKIFYGARIPIKMN